MAGQHSAGIHVVASCLVSIALFYVTVKAVVSVDLKGMLRKMLLWKYRTCPAHT